MVLQNMNQEEKYIIKKLYSLLQPHAQYTPLIEGAPDSAFSASSVYDAVWNCSKIRFSTPHSFLMHESAQANPTQHFIQVDFDSVKLIGRVGTKGRPQTNQRLTSYKIAYSFTGSEHDLQFLPIVFEGNVDADTPRYHTFKEPIAARMVRLYPVTFKDWISFRWELYEINM